MITTSRSPSWTVFVLELDCFCSQSWPVFISRSGDTSLFARFDGLGIVDLSRFDGLGDAGSTRFDGFKYRQPSRFDGFRPNVLMGSNIVNRHVLMGLDQRNRSFRHPIPCSPPIRRRHGQSPSNRPWRMPYHRADVILPPAPRPSINADSQSSVYRTRRIERKSTAATSTTTASPTNTPP